MRKVFIHRINDFLRAGSPEKCMMLFICPHIRGEKSQLSNKQHFMSESAPLLSDSKPRCEARSLLKKTERAISADSSESFRKALMFGNMWKAGTPGCHPMYSVFLLMSSLSIPTRLIVSFICSKMASSARATCKDSQKSCFFTLRMNIYIITEFLLPHKLVLTQKMLLLRSRQTTDWTTTADASIIKTSVYLRRTGGVAPRSGPVWSSLCDHLLHLFTY